MQTILVKKYIKPLRTRFLSRRIGEKAAYLRKIKKLGICIPEAFTCTWDAHRRFVQGDLAILDDLREELTRIVDPQKSYAVRSSANIEDAVIVSFAGQFESVLNVQSVDGILDAIMQVWEETNSDRLLSYLKNQDMDAGDIKMAVIIQEMVSPVLSGVVLTRNPVTYTSEIIIEAVEGYGDLLMQKGSNALRWIVKDNKISETTRANKKYLKLVEKLAEDSARIKRSMKMDVDVEWVFDGNEIFYVQCRPISSLSKIKIYSNRISRDMLPGMIKPLVWSVNIPLVNSVWIDILESIVGPLGIQATDLAHAFYYRTYFNMGIFGEVFKSLGMPPDALEIMMGLGDQESSRTAMRPGKEIIRHIPRILRFMIKNLFLGGQIRRDIGSIEADLAQLDFQSFDSKTHNEIFGEIDELKTRVKKIAYYNIVTPLLMAFHNRMLKQHLERMQVDFLAFDLMESAPENVEFDPNFFLEKLNKQFYKIPRKTQKALLKDTEKTLNANPEVWDFQKDLTKFIQRFGHFSDSGNDFSYSPWRENPEMILRMIADFERSEDTGKKIAFGDIRSGFFRQKMLGIFSQNARKYRILRERVSSDYIFGYGIFRYYFLALGKKLVDKKILNDKEDVFYLSEEQIREAFAKGLGAKELRKIVSLHKKKMQSQKNISPPELIYGDNEPILDIEAKSEYHGIPASAGFYKGPARVVNGVKEFKKVKQGDVLIIPFSDVGWTPLFPKAGAVVSESGGMLSHCAIVAREYAIPSIVSALGVMTIKDGQTVTVDANAGVLYIS